MRNPGSSVQAERAISIVEDDESLRLALVGLLRSMAHEAHGYATAEEFLAADEGDLDCVITDIQLPGMNGLEMLRHLRERGDPVPVIVVTARDEKRWLAEATAGGALCLLRKPFETRDLLDCLDRAFAA
jgi:FixJ family two-component response regulator